MLLPAVLSSPKVSLFVFHFIFLDHNFVSKTILFLVEHSDGRYARQSSRRYRI